MVEPLGVPYEQALIELDAGPGARRGGERRAAAATLDRRPRAASARCGAQPALEPLRDRSSPRVASRRRARKTRDYRALTPQELAVTRLVVVRHDEPRGRPRS